MKLKHNKKKMIIILSLLLIFLITFGIFKGYQSFRHDQHQTAMDMDNMMGLFNMQLQIPNQEKPGSWTYIQFKTPNETSFDSSLFFQYLLKKATFREIQYKDVEPQWSLLPTGKDSRYPNTKSTAECLKNFNDNLLYNPKYEQYKADAEFDKPISMDYLTHNSREVVKLMDKLYHYSEAEGISFRKLADNPCPSQYLPK